MPVGSFISFMLTPVQAQTGCVWRRFRAITHALAGQRQCLGAERAHLTGSACARHGGTSFLSVLALDKGADGRLRRRPAAFVVFVDRAKVLLLGCSQDLGGGLTTAGCSGSGRHGANKEA